MDFWVHFLLIKNNFELLEYFCTVLISLFFVISWQSKNFTYPEIPPQEIALQPCVFYGTRA